MRARAAIVAGFLVAAVPLLDSPAQAQLSPQAVQAAADALPPVVRQHVKVHNFRDLALTKRRVV